MAQQIEILPLREVRLFDKPPILNSNDQLESFKLEAEVKEFINQIRKAENKVGFLLQYGYFKAAKRFFAKEDFKKSDIKYVSKLLGCKDINISNYEERTFRKHKQAILSLKGFKDFSEDEKLFKIELDHMVSKQMHPRRIFFALIDFLVSKKISIPNYSIFARMMTHSFNIFELKLLNLIEKNISEENREVLDGLLNTSDDPGAYKKALLTRLKYINQSLKPKKIRQSIQGFLIIQKLFEEVKPLINALNLSSEATKYYAVWVIKARTLQLGSFSNSNKVYLHLLSFINHQYCTWQDMLIDILLRTSQERLNKVAKTVDNSIIENNERKNKLTHLVVSSLKKSEASLVQVRKIIFAEKLSNHQKIRILRKMFNKKCNEVDINRYQELEKQINNELSNSNYYHALQGLSKTIQSRIADIVRYVNFKPETKSKPLMQAILNYQAKKGLIKDSAPTGFLDDQETKLIFVNDKFNVSLYKALLFMKLADAIKNGSINLLYSYKYLPVESYMIADHIWQEEKEPLIKRANLQEFTNIKGLLCNLKEVIEKQYYLTNCNIASKANVNIKFDKEGRFKLHTPKVDKPDYDKISSLLTQDKYKSILEIFSELDRVVSFTDYFKHYKTKKAEKKPSKEIFYAGVFALGANIGLYRLANTSIGINFNTLYNTVNWYFTLENLCLVNKSLVQFMHKLWLPTLFKKEKELLHSSGDAKKFIVSAESLNSNYSYKYHNSTKVGNVYTFIDERQILFYTTIFSSTERDAAYVIDGLLHNEELNIDMHSTDTLGYTEVIFAISYLIGVDFAPRIKNISAQSLVAFDKATKKELMKKYKGDKILPVRYVNTSLIIKYWDDILRLIVSIKLRETQASKVLRRLNSYTKQHQLYQALKEFGKIIKTIFILKYIDSIDLRQKIEKQLNKGELSNRFSSVIFFANNQEFSQSTKEDQEIAATYKIIIQNLTILWNYLELTKLIIRCDLKEKEAMLETIKQGSIITWQHINLLGTYDFTSLKNQDINKSEVEKILSYKAV